MIRQHSFYMEDESWGRLRSYCLERHISVSSLIVESVTVFTAQEPVAKPVAPATGATGSDHYFVVADTSKNELVEQFDTRAEAEDFAADNPDLEVSELGDLLDQPF